ncbi:MAG: 1-deoxy-D-xylulose-5-phosphate reductoisomerase [Rikenellaceae bacterium]
MDSQIQKIALLGATGSIGEQTLDIIRNNKDKYEITSLSSNKNWQKLAELAIEFEVDSVVIADKSFYNELSESLKDEPIKVYAGNEAVSQIVASENVDTVVNAIVGYAGLMPALASIRAKKKLALANKESLVVAGEILMREALENNSPILPIDSEHSAVFQCVTGEYSDIEKIILTASGGPFLSRELSTFSSISVEEALQHPNWDMGAKITIDSATMVNKAFEVIEAHHLFGASAEQIDVVIHPQSVVHSMVEFRDGAIKAQLGTPDMRMPIQYALSYPVRESLPSDAKSFSFRGGVNLSFMDVEPERYPSLEIAYRVIKEKGNLGCIFNAANEVAVEAFLNGEIKFTDISKVIEQTLEGATKIKEITLENLATTNAEAREISKKIIKNLK